MIISANCMYVFLCQLYTSIVYKKLTRIFDILSHSSLSAVSVFHTERSKKLFGEGREARVKRAALAPPWAGFRLKGSTAVAFTVPMRVLNRKQMYMGY